MMPCYLSILWAEGTEWGRHADVTIPRRFAGLFVCKCKILREGQRSSSLWSEAPIYSFSTWNKSADNITIPAGLMFATMWADRTCRCIIQLSSDCWKISGTIAVGCGLWARNGVPFFVNFVKLDIFVTWCSVSCPYCELRARNGVDTLVSPSLVDLRAYSLASARY